MTNRLDNRAQRARQAIDHATATLDPGPFAPQSRGRAIAVSAAAIVAVAILGLGVWWRTTDSGTVTDDVAAVGGGSEPGDGAGPGDEATSGTDDDDTEDPGTVADGAGGADGADEQILVFDAPVEGHEAAIVAPGGDWSGAVLFDIYGRADADNPFVDGDLVFARAEAGVLSAEEIDTGVPRTVGDTTVWVDATAPEGVNIAWIDADGGARAVLSWSMTEAELLDVASSTITAGELDPGGLDLLATDVDRDIVSLGINFDGTFYVSEDPNPLGTAWIRLWSGVEDGAQPTTDEVILLATWLSWFDAEGGPAAAYDARRLESITVADGRDVDIVVIDQPSLFGELAIVEIVDATGAVRSIVAQAGDESNGIDLDRLAALAITVRPATADEVAALRRTGEEILGDDPVDAPGADDAVAEGPVADIPTRGTPVTATTLPNGDRWILSHTDDQACVMLAGHAAEWTFETCTEGPPVAADDGSRWAIFAAGGDGAIAALTVDSLPPDEPIVAARAVRPDGSIVEGGVVEPEAVTAGDGTWFVVTTGDGPSPVELQLQSPDGTWMSYQLPEEIGDRTFQTLSIVPAPPAA